ncbi:DUF881 domain-containing protein [Phycicoccus flavus]|uniref:DUF881 domain-containing protein n=1 Tax=Phycicoccus flavus TaxID=2502783 RepID=UPI001F329FDF|nr:DUF881 domain-containing protein [Phycicoccus flavus]
MTLITTMMQRPLDPGYAAAADRRERLGQPRATSLRSPLLLAATVGIGLVLGVASTTLTAPDSPRAAARADLVRQIEDRRVEVDRLSVQAQDLQAQVTALEASTLDDGGLAETSRTLSTVAGALPMEGPGIRVTLDDAPDADTATGEDASLKRVFARDLQYVTNAMWEAGAEAISINGNRLTSVAAIRFAGSALVVHNRPLARPYVITALGNPDALPSRFADGAGGVYISALHSNYGVRADTEVSDRLEVPAALGLTTRVAQVVDTGSASGSDRSGADATGGAGG